MKAFTPLEVQPHPTKNQSPRAKAASPLLKIKSMTITKPLTGFTLIESLISTAVLVILVVTATSVYFAFEKRTALSATARDLTSILALARSQTLASENLSSYGVYIDDAAGKFVLFKGIAYNPSASDNEDHLLPSRVNISTISLNGGGQTIIFNRLSGETSNFGSVSLETSSDAITIYIYKSGQASLKPEAISTGAGRVSDTRHLHFDLGWSIQSSNNLILEFPGFSTETIPMASYFNATSSEFDWQGTISVDGKNQELRIHTHFLDATDTNLCIHRDRQKNTKELNVKIDSNDIVSYDANDNAVVGSWGGIMAAQ